ncbi:hypothetical protein [Rhodococcus sp. 06-235-1A]|uniref:hypothetical protein n=1 Tax=Rhodococcus sp. 06-235-1A TaxID=2022508 RepID=UPI0015C68E17|nr:hypothetical protein [Rhodococcus sp. 06-235-1A]
MPRLRVRTFGQRDSSSACELLFEDEISGIAAQFDRTSNINSVNPNSVVAVGR